MFDFDGTLADSFPWFAGVLNDVADRYRFRRVDAHEVEELRSLGSREVMKRVGAAPWKLPLIAAHMRRLKARDVDRIPLFPGVPEMLHALRGKGVEMAVVSSNALPNVLHVLGPSAALISHFECSVSMFGKKPRFQRLLRRAGVGASQVLCVGDEIRDADAARAAGIPFGAVTWGYTTAPALLRTAPAEVFENVADIVPAVCG